MEVKLFTTDCPRCKVLEAKLKEKGINYSEHTDLGEMIQLGITSAPYLMIDKDLFDFSDAINWIKEQKNVNIN